MFLAVGFETTAPSTAVTLLQARERNISNFSVFCNHVTIVPPLKAILDSPGLDLDGFLGPGHVSTVIGTRPYRFVPEQYRRPLGHRRFRTGRHPPGRADAAAPARPTGAARSRTSTGGWCPATATTRALELLREVFVVRPHFEWRGLGFIAQSALAIAPEFAAWDAELRYEVPGVRVADPKACQCGEVLKGALRPWECKVFGTACTPETPIGTCMVSSEGACAAYYNYGRYSSRSRIPVHAASG